MALFIGETMIRPTFKEFCRFTEQGNLIPVYQELLMDLETPLSFFKRLERDRYSFLLESVEGSERWARYSFLGTRPQRIFKARGNEAERLPFSHRARRPAILRWRSWLRGL